MNVSVHPTHHNHPPAKHTLAVLCVALAALAILGACAPKTSPLSQSPAEEEPVVWDLSLAGQAVYYYLLLQEAQSERNATIAGYALKNLLEIDPTPKIHAEAANHYWRQGKVNEARAVLKRGVELYTENRDLALLLADTYLVEKRPDDAITTVQLYLQNNPGDVFMLRQLVEMMVQAEQYAAALDTLNDIPEDELGMADKLYKAKTLQGLNRPHDAEELLKSLIEEDPDYLEAWAELAYVYEQQKEYAAAEETYSRLLEMGESSQELILRLIELNLKLNNPDTAYALMNKGPMTLSFALTAGTMFLENQFYDKAESIFAPLLEKDPVPPEAWFYMALLRYEGQNDPEAAQQLLANVPREHKAYPRSLRFRAHLLYDLGRQEEALDLLEQARTDFPDDQAFWALQARLLQDDGQYAAAETLLQKGLKKWPEDPELLYLMGMVYEYRDQQDISADYMERIIAIDPDYADALNYLGYLLADNNEDLDRALVLISRAMEKKPDSGYITDSLAWAYYRLGRLDEAWETIRQAVEMLDDDPIIWEHYGDIARSLGKTDEAAKGYRNSLKHGPEDPDAVRKKLDAL